MRRVQVFSLYVLLREGDSQDVADKKMTMKNAAIGKRFLSALFTGLMLFMARVGAMAESPLV